MGLIARNGLGGLVIPPGLALDPDAATFLASAGISDPTITNAINNLTIGLKNNNNLWNRCIAIYPMVGGNATAHSKNLKALQAIDQYNLSFTGTFNGPWTHTNEGAQATGASAGSMNTGLDPVAILSPNWAHLSYWAISGNTSTQGSLIGMGANCRMAYSPSDGRIYGMVGTNYQVSITGSPTGYIIATRNNANDFRIFQNGTQLLFNSLNFSSGFFSAPIQLNNVSIPPEGASTTANSRCGFATIGRGLAVSEAQALSTIVATFQAALGR